MLRIGVDIGGTFTDFVAWRRGENTIISEKVPSTPPFFAEGFKNGFRLMLERLQPKPTEQVFVVHGTTVSTNTLIERSGARCALLVTTGFRDVLELQRLRLRQPLNMLDRRVRPLIPRNLVFEVDERLNAFGSVVTPLDFHNLDATIEMLEREKIESAVISFLHSYRNAEHEEAARNYVKKRMPHLDVSISSEVWPHIGEYERTVTSVLNSYVRPKMQEYISDIEGFLLKTVPNARLYITRSNGGVMAAEEARLRAVQTLLSGPASGVTAVASTVISDPDTTLLGMDMGGTSTDLSLIRQGRPSISVTAEVGDFPLVIPVTGIEAIGAGGGSIAELDKGVLRIGPRSAGARPGPACFGRGGTEVTITDAYLICGYLDPDTFLGGRMKLDLTAAETAIAPLAKALDLTAIAAAEACIAVATSNMVASVLPYLARYGVSPVEVTMVAYGGNGPIHAPLLAMDVGITRVLVPTSPSVLCAVGGLVSKLTHDLVRAVHGLELTPESLRDHMAELAAEARSWLLAQSDEADLKSVKLEYSAAMRYLGQSFELDILLPQSAIEGSLESAASAFHAEHERLYIHSDSKMPVEFIELRARIEGELPTFPLRDAQPSAGMSANAVIGTRSLSIGGEIFPSAHVYSRLLLGRGDKVKGPAIIEQGDATILVPDTFIGEVLGNGELLLSKGS